MKRKVNVYINGNRVVLNPTDFIGKGGEAEVYKWKNEAAKIYKTKYHPDFHDVPDQGIEAEKRIAVHQTKLPDLMKLVANLPDNDVLPISLITDDKNKIIGYTMPFLPKTVPLQRYHEKSWHDAGISNNKVITIFRSLHAAVTKNHARHVVIGDFNPLNVLLHDELPYIIDTDSFQFGSYYCYTFTDRFVDPRLCDPNKKSPDLDKPHDTLSDWYAFATLLFYSFLCIGPYSGVYLPKDKSKACPQGLRPLKRITVFDPDILYPKDTIAFHYKVLPDDLLNLFEQIYAKDYRIRFPIEMLNTMRWTKCVICGIEHARSKCPVCTISAPAAVLQTIIIRGKVKSTSLFKTKGLIVFATIQNGKLLYLYNEGNEFYREGRRNVIAGLTDPENKYRISSDSTYIAKGDQLIKISPVNALKVTSVSTYKDVPMFDATSNSLFYLKDGRLLRDEPIAPKHIGNILDGQTLFWVGQHFGFGYYSAGEIRIAFVFDAANPGINDGVKLPAFKGEVFDTTTLFTSKYCWFLASIREGSNIVNKCFVITSAGHVIAKAEAIAGDNSWLSTIRGKCATGNALLVATYKGIVRLELQNDKIVETTTFPDTEPFVSQGSYIFPGEGGLFIVDPQEIRLLAIS